MKNLELKKMSLANIENRLTPEEMENVMAGSWGSKSDWCNVGAFFAAAAVIVASGGVATPVAAAGLASAAAWGLSC